MTDEEIEKEAEISFKAIGFIDPTHIIAFSKGYLAGRQKGLEELVKGIDDYDAKDAARFQWLIEQGVAWRGCYDPDWLPGEWLYAAHDARNVVDEAIDVEGRKDTKT